MVPVSWTIGEGVLQHGQQPERAHYQQRPHEALAALADASQPLPTAGRALARTRDGDDLWADVRLWGGKVVVLGPLPMPRPDIAGRAGAVCPRAGTQDLPGPGATGCRS